MPVAGPEAADGEAGRIFSKKHSAAALPVASITAARSNVLSKLHDNNSGSRDTLRRWGVESSSDASLHDAKRDLSDLLASAVPLKIIIKL